VLRCELGYAFGLTNARLSSTRMTFRPFTIPAAKSKSFNTIDAIDVAARYLVYKLYKATDGRRCGGRRYGG
jgi:hypothetical protein